MNKDNKDNNPVEIPDVRTIRFFDDDDTEYKHPLIVAPYVSYKFIMQTIDATAEAFQNTADDKKETYAINNALNCVCAIIARAVVEHLTKIVNSDIEQKTNK